MRSRGREKLCIIRYHPTDNGVHYRPHIGTAVASPHNKMASDGGTDFQSDNPIILRKARRLKRKIGCRFAFVPTRNLYACDIHFANGSNYRAFTFAAILMPLLYDGNKMEG